jgi:hypothetical protein
VANSKKDAAWFQEINGLEPKAIDHRRQLCSALGDPLSPFELMRFIVHAPGKMMAIYEFMAILPVYSITSLE